MEGKQRLRVGGTNGSGGPAAGTAGILELSDDVMVYILQLVEDGNPLLVVIPSVGEPGPDDSFRGQRQRWLDPCARCRPIGAEEEHVHP